MSRRRKALDPASDQAMLVYGTETNPDWPYVALDIMCRDCPGHRLVRFLRETTVRGVGPLQSEPDGAVEWTVSPDGPMRLKAHLRCAPCGRHVQLRKERVIEALAQIEATRGKSGTAQLTL